MNPAMICGPILFKAQVGQWIEQIGRLAAGLQPNWPSKYDTYYDIIDVRDLVKAQRLAAESTVDHRATHGGPPLHPARERGAVGPAAWHRGHRSHPCALSEFRARCAFDGHGQRRAGAAGVADGE